MKRLFFLFMFFSMMSCGTPESISGLSTDDFSTIDNVIFYKNEPFAKLQAITYSLDNKKLVKELNFKLIKASQQGLIENMIRYIYQTHKHEEIEVEFYIDENAVIL